MSKKTTATAKNTTTGTRYDAFSVREYEVSGEKRSEWNRLGAAWAHQDGKGFNVVLHALPVSGQVVLRLHEPKEDGTE